MFYFRTKFQKWEEKQKARKSRKFKTKEIIDQLYNKQTDGRLTERERESVPKIFHTA